MSALARDSVTAPAERGITHAWRMRDCERQRRPRLAPLGPCPSPRSESAGRAVWHGCSVALTGTSRWARIARSSVRSGEPSPLTSLLLHPTRFFIRCAVFVAMSKAIEMPSPRPDRLRIFDPSAAEGETTFGCIVPILLSLLLWGLILLLLSLLSTR